MAARRSDPRSGTTAARLFDGFLDDLEADRAPSFESLVAAHPEHAEELQRLHAGWRRIESSLEGVLPEPLPEQPPGAEAPGTERPPHRPDQVLGDFRLVRLLGRGAMGEVWEAEQVSLGRRVALKLLRPERRTAERARQLVHEARAGGRLDHPGIVAVHAAGEVEGVPYIAQQLVGEGVTLADLIARTRDLPPRTAEYDRRVATLFLDVARAVQAAHEAGILHRDLKPSNILLGPGDRPLVSDFGLAHLPDEARQAEPGMVGTCPYMSPEQVAGRNVAIDGRSDVFGLGAVLYETLTLRRAFEGDTAPQVLQRVVHEEPPDPRTIRANVPAELAVICLKALEKDRADRYASMQAMAEDLRRFLVHEPIRAAPPGPVVRARKWILRHPTRSTAMGLVGVVLVIVLLQLRREKDLTRQATRERDRANELAEAAGASERLAERRAAEALRQSYTANVHAAAVHLDRGEFAEARRRLRACPAELRGWEWDHFALRVDGSDFRLEGHGGAVTSVAATANGRGVVTASMDGRVRVWEGTTGRLLNTLGDGQVPIHAVAVTADGRMVVAGADDGRVHVWDGVTGRSLYVLEGHTAAVRAVDVTRDGWTIVSGSDDGTAHVWDGKDGQDFDVRPPIQAAIRSVALSADGRRFVTGSRHGMVQVWDVRSQGLLWDLQWTNRGEVAVDIDRTGARVLAETRGGGVQVWEDDGQQGVLVGVLDGDGRDVRALSTNDDASLVVTASADEVQVWDVAAGRLLATLTGHDGPVTAAAVSGNGRRFVVGDAHGTALLWDERMGAAASVVAEGLVPPPTLLSLSGNGRRLVAAGPAERVARQWDVDSGAALPRLVGHEAGVTALAMGADGVRVVTGSYDRHVRLWHVASGELLQTRRLKAAVTALAWAGAADRLAAAGADGRVHIWSWAGGETEVLESPCEGFVSSLHMSADGRLVAGCGSDGTTFLWDGRDDVRVLRQGPGWGGGILSLSSDGGVVALAEEREDLITVWDTVAASVRSVVRGEGRGFAAFVLDPRGARLISAPWGSTALRIQDEVATEPLAQLFGHAGMVTALTVSRDGSRLVSAGAEGSLRVWRARVGDD